MRSHACGDKIYVKRLPRISSTAENGCSPSSNKHVIGCNHSPFPFLSLRRARFLFLLSRLASAAFVAAARDFLLDFGSFSRPCFLERRRRSRRFLCRRCLRRFFFFLSFFLRRTVCLLLRRFGFFDLRGFFWLFALAIFLAFRLRCFSAKHLLRDCTPIFVEVAHSAI